MAKGFTEFKKEISDSQELYTKYQEILKKLVDNRSAENDGELVVLAAKEMGYDITLSDLERDVAALQELDLDEMEAVSGGIEEEKEECTINWKNRGEDEKGHNNWCVTLWHCYYVTCHTETKSKRVACFTDYSCENFFQD